MSVGPHVCVFSRTCMCFWSTMVLCDVWGRPSSWSSWSAVEQITALLSCRVTLSVVVEPSNGYGGIDPNTWMPNFKKTQSSSMQNLLRITFIPLEIGLGWIVFQILCRSMALPFELPAVPPRSPDP